MWQYMIGCLCKKILTANAHKLNPIIKSIYLSHVNKYALTLIDKLLDAIRAPCKIELTSFTR